MIDLHCHSSFSDGELAPDALLQKAIDAKVAMLALTDHDTTAGLLPLRQAATGQAIKIINGIELSVRWKKYDIHIIGLMINPEASILCDLIVRQNENRTIRAQQISMHLKDCGIKDAYQKAADIAGHGRISRPHFAQVLVNEGKVPTMQAAFKHFLSRGRKAYVPTAWASVEDVVAAIVGAGGQAVIAHPLKYALTQSKLHELIIAFRVAGGVGIEVVSGAATALQVNYLADICHRFKLLASTGSDYHGDTYSYITLGRQPALPVKCTPIWQQWLIE
jgi:predicted metal-dependent phosphoesterase TrpH